MAERKAARVAKRLKREAEKAAAKEAKLAEAGITGGAANTEPNKGSEIEFGFSAVCEEIATESIQMSVVVTAILFCVTPLSAVCGIGFSTVTAVLTVQAVVVILKSTAAYVEQICYCQTMPDHFLTPAAAYFCDSEHFGNYVIEHNGMFEVVSICLTLLLCSKLTDTVPRTYTRQKLAGLGTPQALGISA